MIPGVAPRCFLSAESSKKRFGAASVEKPVEKLLVAQEQWVQFMRKGENHMEVGGIDDFCPAFVHPRFPYLQPGSWGSCGCGRNYCGIPYAHSQALGNIDSELSGFTVQDRLGSFALGL